MLERGRGRVINIVSSAGHDRWPGASAYSVSKAAVIKVAENLAREVRDRGVAVFSFHPGLLDVGLTRAHLDHGPVGNPSSDRIWKWLRDQRDAGHFTSYDRVAHSILLLADGTADVLSGRYISVDDDIPALCAQVSADRRQR
jgi:NAD(P)-dependent dehydrogenase (short-subunit alcohol dehydrogenase family)